MFSCEYCEIYKNTDYKEHLQTVASGDTGNYGKTYEDMYNESWDIMYNYEPLHTRPDKPILSNVRSHTRALHYLFASVLPY